MAVKSRFVIGRGPMLEVVVDAWTAATPADRIVRIELPQAADYRFDWSALDAVGRGAEAFMAFDEIFGNFTRMELFQVGIERGFQLAPFVSPRAMVAATVKIGPNTYIGDGVIVGAHSSVEYNCVLRAGAVIGAGVRIKPSCWIAGGVHVGDGAEIGAHSTLREGVFVAASTKIGRNCELGMPGHYRQDVAPRTVFDPRYDAPIFTYGN